MSRNLVPPQSSTRRAGFSLLETMIAMVVLVLALLPLAETLTRTMSSNLHQTQREDAMYLSQQQAEQILQQLQQLKTPCSGNCPSFTDINSKTVQTNDGGATLTSAGDIDWATCNVTGYNEVADGYQTGTPFHVCWNITTTSGTNAVHLITVATRLNDTSQAFYPAEVHVATP